MILNNRLKTPLLLLLFLFGWACVNQEQNNQAKNESPKAHYYSTKHLIQTTELMNQLNAGNIKIIDFRKPEKFKKGHIPNAINIWRPVIQNDSFPYGGMMIEKQKLAIALGELGISSNDKLIIYDNNGACDGSRLWWILKQYGFENTKLLNGGWKSWRLDSGQSVTSVATFDKKVFNFKETSPMQEYITLQEVKSNLQASLPVRLLDTRSTSEYIGEVQKNGASSAGRIPTSTNIDWVAAIRYDSDMRFKSIEELIEIYPPSLFGGDNMVNVYCHSGVRSAHTTFVLTELLGYQNIKNYDGSWTEWSYYPELPLEKDIIDSLNN